MKELHWQPRSLPLDDSWQVIVLGGGPAGCAAATAAAREGAKTLLIEQTGSLGGMGTSALVPAWTPFSDQERIIYGGLAAEVFAAAKRGMAHVRPEALDWVPIDAERLKRVYDDLLGAAGVTVLFNTFFSAVETDPDGRVRAVILSNKAGLSGKSAAVYIDCTGDADLCAWAGGQFQQGDESGTGPMPSTHCFVLSNVNTQAYKAGPVLHCNNPQSPIHAIVASGKYPLIPDLHLCSNVVGPGTVGFNAGHLFAIDGTKPESVSRGLMHGRKIAAAYRDALAEFHPAAFGDAFLVGTGSLLGIRETRRIVGEYVLTLQDYLRRATFADEICRNSYFIDVHAKVKAAFNDLSKVAAWEKTTLRYGPGESHGIPYRCLIPRGLGNVLVAGRSISCEQLVQGSIRTMPCCLAMGQAAGAAAAIAAGAAGDVRGVEVALLRRRLAENGAYLPAPAEEPAPARIAKAG